uniref:Zinc metalloproteinase nas-17 n=2 Tax=Caenorhabditis elegans TaxID=6239 RepID=NAS17_CAEEL|nr:RecName: Full=Zinc metalloproteinase nas-17; AltName: Full=Nematode astacin 17; Flags: Precursor [Caenorhabditis elegans]
MFLRPSTLLLTLFLALVAGSAIRKDVDEFDSNKGKDGIVDGDIMLTEAQLRILNGTAKRSKRQITKIWKKWPDAKVFYYYENEFTSLKRELMSYAMAHISSNTCVKFQESNSATNRIRFTNTGGCASYIGMNGGEQTLWFGDGCLIFGTAVHEIMHSLGLFHTHSRFDRDNFLSVSYKDVPENMVGNLEKETEQTTYNAVPFEYGSTMLYRYNTFGEGTLVSKNEDYQKTMGLRRVSFYDLVNINVRYSCGCAKSLTCENGGYTNPSNCATCVCPTGFAGTLCNEAPSNTIKLTAESYWKGYWVNFGYSTSIQTTNYYLAYLWITAPADKTIEVKIMDLSGFTCSYGCNYNGVEVKYMGDPRITNPLRCCAQDTEYLNQVISSKQNPTPIVMQQRYGSSKLTIHYRYVDTPLSSNKKSTNGYDNYQYYV